MADKLTVVELFAGVGGFRLGLEGWLGMSATSSYTQPIAANYQVAWSNQWEPATKVQHASQVYVQHWGDSHHSNEDIETVDVANIPDHDVLVGGFPCQDYSVATTLKNAKGLIGKKGILWWSIHKILTEKIIKPKYLIFENVDRLLISPSSQRGRDFAIILKSLSELGYAVEWRVINAADYGMPQKRKRVFILAYHKSTNLFKQLKSDASKDWLLKNGLFAQTFPVLAGSVMFPHEITLKGDIVDISENFNKQHAFFAFQNTGVMVDGVISTIKTQANYQGKFSHLADVLQHEQVPDEFYVINSELERWQYLKGSKKEIRKTADGFEYNYSEGGMSFPDALDKPARTIITGEGGASPSRFKHVIYSASGYRRLTPLELERLNMFPDNHTHMKEMSATKRAFFMGNALVVGVVEKIGEILAQRSKQ